MSSFNIWHYYLPGVAEVHCRGGYFPLARTLHEHHRRGFLLVLLTCFRDENAGEDSCVPNRFTDTSLNVRSVGGSSFRCLPARASVFAHINPIGSTSARLSISI